MTPAPLLPQVLENGRSAVELAAGHGKTETIARLVNEAATSGVRCLVLTHTHAGVDALNRRLRRFGIARTDAYVRTVDSWAFDLVSHFPQLSEYVVPDTPDWSDSSHYHHAAALASASRAVEKMLTVSYGLIVVDEYQDCSRSQHSLVLAISGHLSLCIFGDRLQGLFFFGKNDPIDWEEDVEPNFVAIEVESSPFRWNTKNGELGDWLSQARRQLLLNEPIDLSNSPLLRCSPSEIQAACFAQPRHPSRVVVIGKWPGDCAQLASRLGGSYTMIEELEGKFLKSFAKLVDEVDHGDPNDCARLAWATRGFAVDCAYGVAAHFDSTAAKRLLDGKSLLTPKRLQVRAQALSLMEIAHSPTKENVAAALRSLNDLPGFKPFRREAWYGLREALSLAIRSEGLSVVDAVVQVRNKLRFTGRRPESRIIARPLLIKGLEFDHSVVTDVEKYDAHELYVCLTRGAYTVTLATNSQQLSASRPGRDG